jgi:hypothetical protein
MSERDLRGLDDEALVEALLQLARRVRVALAEGDQHAVRRVFEQVREAAKGASHHQRDILEVAEGLLRVVSAFPSGTRERALARFADEHPAFATNVLEAALHGTLVHVRVPKEVRAAVDQLVENGALRSTTEGRLDIPPALRGTVSDLVEPLPLRLWKRVEAAREAVLATPPDERAEKLARALLISKPQAQVHLQLHPLTSSTLGAMRPLRQRETVRRPPVMVRRVRVEEPTDRPDPAPSESVLASVENRTPAPEPCVVQVAGLV